MKAKFIAMSLGAVMLVSAPASAAHGIRIYYRGSEGAIAKTVAAPVMAGPVQYAPQVAAPAVPVVAAPAAVATPGCVNCTPGSAQARNYGAGTPNAIVTFLNPYTNKAISIPMTLPVGKPTIVTKSDRIIYDYSKCLCFGRYIVVRFFPDGTVMTEYH